MPYISTKTLDNYPCCHRQHNHLGDCRLLHGYSRSFTLKFKAKSLIPGTNFVVDFGGGAIKAVRLALKDHFDHTCLINGDDDELEMFKELHNKGIIKLVILPNVSMEATAKYVLELVNTILTAQKLENEPQCFEVECRENNKNSAIYEIN